jgi:hypothetical protein
MQPWEECFHAEVERCPAVRYRPIASRPIASRMPERAAADCIIGILTLYALVHLGLVLDPPRGPDRERAHADPVHGARAARAGPRPRRLALTRERLRSGSDRADLPTLRNRQVAWSIAARMSERTPLESTPATKQRREDPAKQPAARSRGRASPLEVDQIVAAKDAAGPATASRIAAPPSVDLGSRELGKTKREPVHVFNLDASSNASARVHIEGSADIHVASAPERIGPSSRSAGAPPIELLFVPARAGRVEAVLVVDLTWHDGAEQVRIPVKASAHVPGQPTLDEQDAERARETEVAREEEARRAEEERTDRLAAKVESEDRRYHSGHLAGLERRLDKLAGAITGVTDKRVEGIGVARTEVDGFKRLPRNPDISKARRFGLLAIDAASLLVGNLAGKAAVAAIKHYVLGESTDGIASAVGSIVEAGFTKAADAGAAAAKAGLIDVTPTGIGPRSPNDRLSADPVAAFFGDMGVALNGTKALNAASVKGKTRLVMMPGLLRTPDATFKAVEAATAAVATEGDAAEVTQAQHCVQHWVSYLSQHNMGELDARQARAQGLPMRGLDRLTNVERANQKPAEHTELPSFDGLVDIGFQVDINRPQTPARAVSVRMNGVRRAVAARFWRQPLANVPIAIRASGRPTLSSAVVPITILRDEAGNIRLTDEVGGGPGWLSRKAGDPRGGVTAQIAGARKLLQDELLSQSLESQGVPMENDSET